MSQLTPEEFQKKLKDQIANINKLKSMKVKVGVIGNGAGAGIYDDDQTVLDIAIKHEYGDDKTPRRSFLRAPFSIKKKEMGDFITKQLNKVTEKGFPAETAVDLIGVKAQSIVQDAFTNGGYGQWQALSPRTVDSKGSSQILVDTGTLRNSITYQVTR